MRKTWEWLRTSALVGSLVLLSWSCSGDSGSKDNANSGSDSAGTAEEETGLGFKVGIMTGTVSQGEDEYRGAEKMIARYGKESIPHVTYPDNFMVEQEAMISQILKMAYDTEVKAIVIAQGVPGSMAAIKRVREVRDDIIFLIYEPHEDPHQISEYADVCVMPDNVERGNTIVELAHKMGATTFVHYSFPRHMSQELLSRRMDIMKTKCTDLGMTFVFANAPDPTGDQGLPGAQKFILEDVPRQVEKYGVDTAFFSTNCGMQEPLIRSALETHAIMPEQCCPSPTHGYPGALGIAISEEDAGDMEAIRAAIHDKIDEGGNSGRMGAWAVSVGMMGIEALTELAIKAVRGEVAVDDQAALLVELQRAAGVEVTLQSFEEKPNYYMFLLQSVIF